MKPIFILLFLSAPLWAREVRLSLPEVPGYATTHNRDLRAAAFRIEEARGRLTQAGRLSNPELEFQHRRATNSPENATEVSLQQRFPLTARLRLEKAVSSAQLAAAQAEFQEARRQTALRAQTAAVRLRALAERREISARQIANSRELAQFLQSRVAAGEVPGTDLTQVELETRQLESELLQLDVERAAVVGELRPLLGVGAQDVIVITDALSAPRRFGEVASIAHRPDLQAAQHNAEAARREVALARANRWEDVGVGLMAESEKTEDAPEGFDRQTMVGFRLSVPLPLWNRNQGRIQETTAAAERARREVGALTATISAEAAAARDEMNTLASLVGDLQTKIIPTATQLEEQLRIQYAAGQSPLTDVLRARDRRLQLQRQHLEALRDYHLARVRLQAATGQILSGTSRSTHPGK